MRLSKSLRHCSKLINRSLYRVSAPPSQRDWSHPVSFLTPSLAPFSAVCLFCSLHQVQWNYTNYGGVALREILSPFSSLPLSCPSCLQGRYERADKRGKTREGKRAGGTSPTSRKGNGSERHRAMKRYLRKTRETIDRKTREERKNEREWEREGGRREGDWLKRRGSSAFSFHYWFRLPAATPAPLSLICQHLRPPKLSNNGFLVSRTIANGEARGWGKRGSRAIGVVPARWKKFSIEPKSGLYYRSAFTPFFLHRVSILF